ELLLVKIRGLESRKNDGGHEEKREQHRGVPVRDDAIGICTGGGEIRSEPGKARHNGYDDSGVAVHIPGNQENRDQIENGKRNLRADEKVQVSKDEHKGNAEDDQ